jgi:hypothetical protein
MFKKVLTAHAGNALHGCRQNDNQGTLQLVHDVLLTKSFSSSIVAEIGTERKAQAAGFRDMFFCCVRLPSGGWFTIRQSMIKWA